MGGEGLSRAVPDNPFHPWGVVTDQITAVGGGVKVDPHDPPLPTTQLSEPGTQKE